MSFSMSEFQLALDKINVGMDDIRMNMVKIPNVANSTINHWYVPAPVAEGIVWLAEKMLELAQKIWDKLIDVLQGVAAPAYFLAYSQDLNDMAALAEGTVANLSLGQLVNDGDWAGRAANVYRGEASTQRNAASKLANICDEMSNALVWAGVAGLAFYVGIGVIIAKFVISMVAAVAALGSVVFSWAGAALIVEEAGVNTAAIAGLVTTLLALIGDQVKEMTSLQQTASSDQCPQGKLQGVNS